MNTHSFDVEDAEKHGVKKAIILEHLKYHQESNIGNKNCTFNGKPHAYLKEETIKKMFPYLNYKSVKRWLNELEDEGVIESIKPGKSSGEHLKYYHVIGHKLPNSQNEKIISQNENSAHDNKVGGISQNENSSIVTNVNNHNERESLPEQIKTCDTIQALSKIWFNYRQEKSKWPTLSEQEMLTHQLKEWGLSKSKKIIMEAMKNGWVSLKEEYLSDNEDDSDLFDNNKIRRINASN